MDTTQTKKVRTRFAPSPTGNMHIGNLRTGLYAYLYAKQNNGVFILRIEDTDQERLVEGTMQTIIDTMKQTGIMFDEGPEIGGPYAPYVQSQRKEIYKKYAEQLVESGGAYYCFCTPERLKEIPDEKGGSDRGARKYDKHCLHLTKQQIDEKLKQGVPYVIRQNVATEGLSEYDDIVFGHIAVPNKELEDNVLLKSDGMPTYNFAHVVDDHLMGITHVIRGVEYLSSTPKYNLLYKAFGWQIPQYMHLPPIMRDEHNKLSKRNGDAGYQDLIARGYLKDAIVNYIALLGWSPKENREKLSFEELEQLFNVQGISKSQSIFDIHKLNWLNSQYIKELPLDEFCKLAEPFVKASDVYGKYDYQLIAKLIQPRIDYLGQISEKINYLEKFELSRQMFVHKKMQTDEELAIKILPDIISCMQDIPDDEFNATTIHDRLIELVAKLGLKNGQVLYIARIAMTATEVTPGGATENAEILGKKRCIERLNTALKFLTEKE